MRPGVAVLFALVVLGPPGGPFGAEARGDDRRVEGLSSETLGRIKTMLDEAVAARRIAGGSALVARHGKVVFRVTSGMQDAEAKQPMAEDTIFRIASMTKPVTSVAVMMLQEEGKLKLNDPVALFIPEFRDVRVLAAPSPDGQKPAPATPEEEKEAACPTVPAERPITIADLLNHTSGISYRFFDQPPCLVRLYAEAGVSDGLVETPGTIADNVRRLARMPLLHQPGAGWNYGLNTDVLGHLVEVASGQTLHEFCERRIFRPLRMNDTHFHLPESKRERLAALYTVKDDRTIRRIGDEVIQSGPLVYSATYPTWSDSRYDSGGAGLVATIGDYHRFLEMLRNRGELDGTRLLRRETVELMTRNYIGEDRVPFSGHGDGFGYGFGVVTERGRQGEPAAVGSFSWGGIFYTYFWVDPHNDLVAILMTQVYPSGHLKLREGFKRLVYEALAPEQKRPERRPRPKAKATAKSKS